MDKSEEAVFCNDGSSPLRVPGFGNMDFHYKLPFASRFSTPFDYSHQPYVTARELAVLRVINSITEDDDWAEAVLEEDTQTLSLWRTQAEGSSQLINENSWTWILRELHDKAIIFLQSKSLLVFDTGAIGKSRRETAVCGDGVETTETTGDLSGFAVYKSDSLIPPSLRTELEQGISCFFNSEDDHGLVYQVNPSMYPLTYQYTPVLTGVGETVSLYGRLNAGIRRGAPSQPRYFHPETKISQLPCSDHSDTFQWLPCELEFRDGEKVAITSYINNLDPIRFANLYITIEKIISTSIEPWNQVIIEAGRGRSPLRILTYGIEYSPPRLFRNVPWIRNPSLLEQLEVRASALDYIAKYLALPGQPDPEGKYKGLSERMKRHWRDGWKEEWEGCRTGNAYSSQVSRRWQKSRTCPDEHPQMGQSLTYDDWKAGRVGACVVPPMSCTDPLARTDSHYVFEKPPSLNLRDSFHRQGLQVIVKMASIEVTPDRPIYSATEWAVEGMADEHIVAVAICYYSVKNIQNPKIGFLHTGSWSCEDYDCEYEDIKTLLEVLDIDIDTDESLALHGSNYRSQGGQRLGTVTARQGRILAYPNHLMTRTEACELQDRSKPGHIRSLTLCLVDPHYRICSTRNVLPQQPEIWFPQALEAITPKDIFLPIEIQEIIRRFTEGWPMPPVHARTIGIQPRKPIFVREPQRWPYCDCIGW